MLAQAARTCGLAALTGMLVAIGLPSMADDASPQIMYVAISPDHLASGVHVEVLVLSTPDVVELHAVVGPRHFLIPMVGAGCFATQADIPRIPWFVHGHFPVRFVGRTTTGIEVAAGSSITVN